MTQGSWDFFFVYNKWLPLVARSGASMHRIFALMDSTKENKELGILKPNVCV